MQQRRLSRIFLLTLLVTHCATYTTFMIIYMWCNSVLIWDINQLVYVYKFIILSLIMILDVNKIQEGECLAWVSSPVRTLAVWTSFNREFKLRVIRQTANARQGKILRYQAIKSTQTCCFKTEIHNYSFDARKYETKTFNENFAKKVRTCRLPFPETWSLNSLIIKLLKH
jgi:hypothetical protein